MTTPPQYDVGCWTRRNSNNNSFIAIQLDEPALVFNRGHCVTGRVVVTPPCDTKFDRLLIDLQAVECVGKGNVSDSKKDLFSNTHSIARHKLLAEAYPPANILERGVEYNFAFSLHIPHQLEPQHGGGSLLPLHYQLAPTVHSHSSEQSVSYQYRVRARLTRPLENNNRLPVICQDLHPIRVMPSYPPLQLDTQSRATRVQLRTGMLRKLSKGEMEIATNETPVFYLNKPNQKAYVNVTITYRAPVTGGDFKPPNIGRLVYRLDALTTGAASMRRYYPRGGDDKAVDTCKEWFETQTAVVNMPHWVLGKHERARVEYVATVTLPLTLPKCDNEGDSNNKNNNNNKSNIVPTFFAPHTSRQYQFAFMLELSDFAPVQFKLPVVVARHDPNSLLGTVKDDVDACTEDPVPPYYTTESPGAVVKLETQLEYMQRVGRGRGNANVDKPSSPSPPPSSSSSTTPRKYCIV